MLIIISSNLTLELQILSENEQEFVIYPLTIEYKEDYKFNIQFYQKNNCKKEV